MTLSVILNTCTEHCHGQDVTGPCVTVVKKMPSLTPRNTIDTHTEMRMVGREDGCAQGTLLN